MHLRHLGYACQNVSLGETTGRTLRLQHLGAERVERIVRENLEGLQRILRWNVAHGLSFFRISSAVVPFASHEAFPLDWRRAFAPELDEIRAFVRAHGLRLSMHPGQYTVLNSPRPDVVEAALREVEYQAAFIDAVDPDQGTVTLHVGGVYGDKTASVDRFRDNFGRLSPLAAARLILENDDKVYHVDDVLGLCEALGVPVVFDYFHHQCHHPGSGWEEGLAARLERVVATWGDRVTKFHLSSRRPGTKTSHADLVEAADLEAFVMLLAVVPGGAYDVMLEAKRKDEAALLLREQGIGV